MEKPGCYQLNWFDELLQLVTVISWEERLEHLRMAVESLSLLKVGRILLG